MKFSDLKGIVGDLGVMKITLKPNAKLVKQRPYWLNPKYKEKVHKELDKMLEAIIIEPVEEFDWVSPMVVPEKKHQGKIRIRVDPRKMNDTSVHDPFPTPFTYEVLENVGGQESYSFTDGFSGYHQIKIVSEDRSKMTIRNRVGMLLVQSNAIRVEECVRDLLQGSNHNVQGVYS